MLDKIAQIRKITKDRKVLLFGSATNNIINEESDIDLMILLNKEDDVQLLIDELSKIKDVYRITVNNYGGGGGRSPIAKKSGMLDIVLITDTSASCHKINYKTSIAI